MACKAASSDGPTTTTRPPSRTDLTKAMIAIQRSTVCSTAASPGRVREDSASRMTAQEYPDSGTGSAPGVATTSLGAESTLSRTWFPEESTTGTSGKARPSSPAVVVAPTIPDLTSVEPHSGQRHRGRWVPHQVQCRSTPVPVRRPVTGPQQEGHLTDVRHTEQDGETRSPTRGTDTRTGPRSNPSRIVVMARSGNRTDRANGSRSRAKSESPGTRTGAQTDLIV